MVGRQIDNRKIGKSQITERKKNRYQIDREIIGGQQTVDRQLEMICIGRHIDDTQVGRYQKSIENIIDKSID